MHRAFGHRTWLMFAAVAGLAVAGCSQSSSSSGGTRTGAAGGETAGSAGASSIDACHLLTKDEIKQQLGVAVNDGRLQTTSSQATCDWETSGSDAAGLTVNVQDFDPNLWNSFTSSPRAKPVSGLGEAAFADVPLSGGLMIRQGKYEVEVGVVSFNMNDERKVAAAKALAALVLPRISGSAQAPR